jgi:hypothetical protein
MNRDIERRGEGGAPSIIASIFLVAFKRRIARTQIPTYKP